MNQNLELLAGILINAVSDIAKPTGVENLQKIHDWNPDVYKGVIYLANAGIKALQIEAEKTATKLDNQAVAKIKETLAASAQQNGLSI